MKKTLRFFKEEFTCFYGGNLEEWIQEYNHFFSVEEVPERFRRRWVIACLEGDAWDWRRSYLRNYDDLVEELHWMEYLRLVFKDFKSAPNMFEEILPRFKRVDLEETIVKNSDDKPMDPLVCVCEDREVLHADLKKGGANVTTEVKTSMWDFSKENRGNNKSDRVCAFLCRDRSEFYDINIEGISVCDALYNHTLGNDLVEDDMKCAATYVRFMCQWLLNNYLNDMKCVVEKSDKKATGRLKRVASTNFIYFSYMEAVTGFEEAISKCHKCLVVCLFRTVLFKYRDKGMKQGLVKWKWKDKPGLVKWNWKDKPFNRIIRKWNCSEWDWKCSDIYLTVFTSPLRCKSQWHSMSSLYNGSTLSMPSLYNGSTLHLGN